MKKIFARHGRDEDGGGGGGASGRTSISASPFGTTIVPAPMFPGHHGIPPTAARRASDIGPSRTLAAGSNTAARRDDQARPPAPTQPISIPSRAPILSYDQATSPSSPTFTGLGGFSPPVASLVTEGNLLVRDHFATSHSSSYRADPFFSDDDDEDPLLPRLRRPAPAPNLIPLSTERRHTLSDIYRSMSPPGSDSSHTDNLDTDLDEVRENLLEDVTQIPLDQPPPQEQPPGYSAHLAEDELRLISTVHLDQNHPAAALFSQMTSTLLSPIPPPPPDLPTEPRETVIGGKKCRMVISTPVEHLNANGTGPSFMRMKRGGKVEGRVEIGNVDHVTGLEISIMGYVSTSFYVRGQYSLIDTMPLARRQMVLYPLNGTASCTPATSAMTLVSENTAEVSGSGVATDSPADGASVQPSTNGPPATVPSDTVHRVSAIYANANPKTVVVGKDTFLAPNQTFSFSLQMPDAHCRNPNVELPSSVQIYQVGVQAGVEYVLRLKMARKSWRMSEHLGLPIIYDTRAFISPRRLRILTTNDALNPGWRTIRLNGGKPIKENEGPEGSTAPAQGAGVEVSLLLPSPPIVYIQDGTAIPPIPFHLHFHSSAILPLTCFSNPKDCQYVVRLMRVATMLIGCEREIRRMEIPSTVELWQEGGPRLVLGAPQSNKDTHRRGSVGNTATLTAGSSGPSRSFTNRRPSFFKRRGSQTQATSPVSPTAEGSLARSLSNAALESAIVEEETQDATPTIVAPLSLGATDVHLLGQLTINAAPSGSLQLKNLVQSFMTPEVGITYVLEVAMKPNNGAVKEAFSHVWGGGIVEVILGHRR